MEAARHAGKVVVVTGGGSGIGRATALRFASEGAARGVIVDRLADRLDRVAGEIEALGTAAGTVEADLGDIGECERALGEAVGKGVRLDVAVSNAAAWTQEPFLDMLDESWLRVIAVNLTAAFAGVCGPPRQWSRAAGAESSCTRRRSPCSAARRTSRTTTRPRPGSRIS